jgi:hypothetical protein
MRFLRGFDDQILEALNSNNPHIHCQAVCAAGHWEVDEAWPHTAALINSKETDKPLLFAPIDAVAAIRPEEAQIILGDLLDSDDEDIVEAASEAFSMAEARFPPRIGREKDGGLSPVTPKQTSRPFLFEREAHCKLLYALLNISFGY